MTAPDAGFAALEAALPEGIVDAHHHLWDLGSGHYPWLQEDYQGESFFLGSYERLRRNYTVADLRAGSLPLRLAASVHIEAERSRDDQLGETAWLAAVHREQSLPTAIVGHVSFIQRDREAVLAGHAACPLVRGIRSKPVTAAGPGLDPPRLSGTMQDPHWLEGLAVLEKYGFSWDLRVPFWHLAEAAEVVAAFPRIPVVVNHCGLPLDRSEEGLAIWRAGLERLAAQSQVVLKLSEMGLRGGVWDAAGNARVVREAVAIFGLDRVMYASNLPVSSLSAHVHDIAAAILAGLPDHSAETLRKVFSENARRFYRL